LFARKPGKCSGEFKLQRQLEAPSWSGWVKLGPPEVNNESENSYYQPARGMPPFAVLSY
jgi:hypothetical protein